MHIPQVFRDRFTFNKNHNELPWDDIRTSWVVYENWRPLGIISCLTDGSWVVNEDRDTTFMTRREATYYLVDKLPF